MQQVSTKVINVQPQAIGFKANHSQAYSPYAGMPMSRDTYESMAMQEQKKKQSSRDNWQKAGVCANIGLAAAFITMAITGILNHKLSTKSLKQESSSIKNAIKNIYEDLSGAKSLEQMSLAEGQETLTNNIINQINKAGEIFGRGGEGSRSVLLYGPPGTGKTTYAKAIAKKMPNTKFVSLDVTKMRDKYFGETEKNLNALIDKICEDANKMAEKYKEDLSKVIGEKVVKSGDKQAIEKAIAEAKAAGKEIPEQERIVVFIDEIDSVMMEDSSSSAKLSNDILNEFKKGFTEKLAKCDNIITIGATNLEIDASKAMLTNGKTLDKPMLDRFALKVRVPNPDKKQVEKFFIEQYKKASLVDKELKEESTELSKLAEYIAKEEHNISFRKLISIVNETANRTTGSGENVKIKDIKQTLKYMKDEFKMTDAEIDAI